MGCCLLDCVGGIILTIFKWALYVLNVLFVIGGIAMIAIGSIVLVNIQSYDAFIEDQAKTGAIILIATGGVTFLVSLLGCCGSRKKSAWMMYIYSAILIGLFVAQMTGGILQFQSQDELSATFRETLISFARDYYIEGVGGDPDHKLSWDKLQSEKFCCGVDTFSDWRTYRPELPAEYPDSCKCTADQEDCNPTALIFNIGCYPKLQPSLGQLADVVAALGVGVAIFEMTVGYRVLKFFKWELIVANASFLVDGVALVVVCSIFLDSFKNFDDFLSDEIRFPIIALICIGAILLLVAPLGVYGVLKHKQNILTLYSVLLFVIFTAQLTTGILTLTYEDGVMSKMRGSMIDAAKTYSAESSPNNNEASKIAWDKVQLTYQCCGVDGFLDWKTYRPTLRGVPDSCICNSYQDYCNYVLRVFREGCFTKLEASCNNFAYAISGTAIGSALIQLLSLILMSYYRRIMDTDTNN
ncbi:uncharacterized protein LOC132201968 [Neocloeon triangulifer]|uniref:uncharacterized protein LOC132201968 n=1 Tax=Neocloeon triangulifer TaxID=2078957 RepID=UPI00286EF63E|nr:uncharacterized protein LOC132201968 [Neocloeon triangulifer]